MKLARAKGRVTLPGTGFKTSRKIPEEVFATGELKIVADLLDGDLANVHLGTVQLGIRHVACIPLRMVRYLDRADMKATPGTSACSISTAARRAACSRRTRAPRSIRSPPKPASRSKTRGSIARRSRRRASSTS